MKRSFRSFSLLLLVGIATGTGVECVSNLAEAQKSPTGISRTSVTAPARAAVQIKGWQGVTMVPGSPAGTVTMQGRGLAKLSGVKVVDMRGRLAPRLRVTLVPGSDIERQMRLAVQAGAAPGRYLLVGFFADGFGSVLPFLGKFDLSVIDAKAGETPLGAMRALIQGGGAPGQGSAQSGGGDRLGLAASAGLPAGGDPRKPDFSDYEPGDSRLMEGASDDPPPPPPPSDKDEDVKVESKSEDSESSDGSAKIVDTVKVTKADGSVFAHTMTFTRDSKGNTTETQSVYSKDSNGTVTSEYSCSGRNCTPDPEKGGCSSKGCRQMAAMIAPMTAVAEAMQKRFIESRFGSLKGDSLVPGGTAAKGQRPTGSSAEVIKDQLKAPLINPHPESSGSSSGNAPGAPTGSIPADRPSPQTGQPAPVDPDRNGATPSPGQPTPGARRPPRLPAPTPKPPG